MSGGPVERLEIAVDGDEVAFRMHARECVTGPSVRVLGTLEQGLLAGDPDGDTIGFGVTLLLGQL